MVQQHQPSSQQQFVKIKQSSKPISKSGRGDHSKTSSSTGSGSRRIFSPVFKLQVLDSYRKDADCQGNQRATARKYGIHRRQIQKWLQMESNLRLAVEQTCANYVTASASLKKASPLLLTDDTQTCIRKSNCDRVIDIDKETTEHLSVHRKPSDMDEEYVNVDEISDWDDTDDSRSSCSSIEKEDKALDLTCATLSKRRFYSATFKKDVIEAFKSNVSCKGNQRATARKFGIHRRQVQKWLNQEADIIPDRILNPSGPICLDLSQKRRLESSAENLAKKSAASSPVSSLNTKLIENETRHLKFLYSSPTYDPSYGSASPSPLSYVQDCAFAAYPPWSSFYPTISVLSGGYDPLSQLVAIKSSSSYIDLPAQYGFGDILWMNKETPLYLHDRYPSIPFLSHR